MYELAHGQSLNQRFTLIRPLGKGGMGEVWLVHDKELDEEVVAKIVPPDAPEERISLLRRECRNARRLVHANIVPVYEFHRGDRVSFITMTYVEGEDIGRYRGLSPREIIRVVLPVAEALDYAHRQGVVHRDLKMTNILVDADGEPRLLDFGVAGILSPESHGMRITGGGSRYSVSPQQIDGEEPQPSDDIYAFGVLVYELITGWPPFWPDISRERIRLETPPPMTSSHAIPEKLQHLVSGCLSKKPADRPPSMDVIKATLRTVLAEEPEPANGTRASTGEVKVTPPPRVGRAQPSSKRVGQPVHDEDAPVLQATLHPQAMSSLPRALPRSSFGWPTISAFVVLLLAAFVVFFFLPRWARQSDNVTKSERSVAPVGSTSTPEAPEEFRAPPLDELKEQAVLKAQAEQVLERVQRLKEELEARDVSRWGGEDYRSALMSLSAGDDHMQGRRFERASESYEQGLEYLESVRSSAKDVVREALAEGRRALDSGDARAAGDRFQLASTIDPGSREAATGLKRAKVLNEVLTLLARGEGFERRGDLRQATAHYERAVALDPLSRAAQNALARVDAGITDEAFREAMSEGMAALSRKDYRAAQEAFRRAQAIRPDSPQITDGLVQAEQGIRRDTIALYHEKARSLEGKEAWRSAAEQYQAVLELDSTIAFAQVGKARCVERAELADRLDFYSNYPQRLSDIKVLEDASSVLDTAKGLEPSGPKLQQQITKLGALIESASIPIRVQLISDNMTEIVIYKVARLGKFERRFLELRPGTYTIVGTRRGYRDVRHQLVVEAGKEPEPLIVSCKEKI